MALPKDLAYGRCSAVGPRNVFLYHSAHLTYSQAHRGSLHAYLLTSSLSSLTHKLTGAHCMLICSQAHTPYLLTSSQVLIACLLAHKLTTKSTWAALSAVVMYVAGWVPQTLCSSSFLMVSINPTLAVPHSKSSACPLFCTHLHAE